MCYCLLQALKFGIFSKCFTQTDCGRRIVYDVCGSVVVVKCQMYKNGKINVIYRKKSQKMMVGILKNYVFLFILN